VSRAAALVDGDWLEARLGDPRVVVLEVDQRPAVYGLGHVPGAHCLDWHTDLQDPVTRDIPTPDALERLWRRVGITADATVVLYGDLGNWYPCFGLWLFKLFGLDDVRLLDGGRQLWLAEERPLSVEVPPHADADAPAARLRPELRAHWQDVAEAPARGARLIDARTPAEYRGDTLAEPGFPQEGAQRPGHIPGALNLPWDAVIGEDGRMRSDADLRALLSELGVDLDAPAITYCRIGERSAHTWFVLHDLLGVEDVRNYDGSWTEWGSMIGMPVALGPEPGELARVSHGRAAPRPLPDERVGSG
jgi:thiosulfate/3-mercaptopyruvate sulfurtransferase